MNDEFDWVRMFSVYEFVSEFSYLKPRNFYSCIKKKGVKNENREKMLKTPKISEWTTIFFRLGVPNFALNYKIFKFDLHFTPNSLRNRKIMGKFGAYI